MAIDTQARVFDRHAAGYDDIAESALGRALRARVRRIVEPLIDPTATVIDIGCGTGLDAAWLAPRVHKVLAVDRSPAMVERARRRCADLANVVVGLVDAGDESLAAIGEQHAPVELILANFGVVNCVDDPDLLGAQLAAFLAPGGRMVAVSMTRWCPIELLIGAATANRDLLRRRSGQADYDGLPVRYESARSLASHFAPSLTIERAEALGTFLPPFEQRRQVQNRPRLLGALATADRLASGIGARLGIGDHHIAVFRRPS